MFDKHLRDRILKFDKILEQTGANLHFHHSKNTSLYKTIKNNL